ncbi:MAG TPA: cytochrome c oxidase subunit 3 [Candidatus Methylomirabilis sp.]|jgi:heme/copper-type cytochrome/quinol oxidase subunit 3
MEAIATLPGAAAHRGKVGIWWFLASEIMVFGGLIASYIISRMGGPGWAAEAHHLSVPLASLNTLVLLTSSLTMVLACAAAERRDLRGVRTYLLGTIVLGLVFLGIKVVEYSGKIAAGITPASAPFWSFYYTMTGLHGLHVLAGIVVNALFFLAAAKVVRHPHRVEMGGLYWHFVDVVWIFLFPLLYLA